MTKFEVIEASKSLSLVDRIDVAMALWDLVDPASPLVDTPPELRAELRRRAEANRANPQPSEEWSVLREKLLRGEI